MYAKRTYNHGEFFYPNSARKLSAEIIQIILEKTSSANWSHLFALKYNISDPKIFHGYMYAIRTYNHGEFFYPNSARKLSAEVMKLFK